MADSLANDDVKYVSYAIVFTKPGFERVMPCGEGSMMLKDRLSDSQFISMLIAKYWGDLCRDSSKAQCKKDAEDLVGDWADCRYLKVYFVNPASWPPDRLFKEERQAKALETLRRALRDE
jgi:hypothetical protein